MTAPTPRRIRPGELGTTPPTHDLLRACPECGRRLRPAGLGSHRLRRHGVVAAASGPREERGA